MKGGSWIAVITAGCFCVLATYSRGVFDPYPASADLGSFVEEKLESYQPRAGEVTLWKATDSVADGLKAKGNGLGVVDRVAVTGERKREECGEDFACLIAWTKEVRQ